MTQELNVTDLDHARSLLKSQGPGAMYDFLSAKGYKYATLANGVAKGNSVAGAVAIDFLKLTASEEGVSLSLENLENIRFQLADEYISTLSQKLKNGTNGVLSSDIDHIEAWSFHTKVFKEYGLTANAWTLNTVFLVMAASS